MSPETEALLREADEATTQGIIPTPTKQERGSLINRLATALRAAEAELASIDAVLARRPALDLPTRRENIEKAISVAKRCDEAEARAEANAKVAEWWRAFAATAELMTEGPSPLDGGYWYSGMFVGALGAREVPPTTDDYGDALVAHVRAQEVDRG